MKMKTSKSALRLGAGIVAVTGFGLAVAVASPNHARITASQANATVLNRFHGQLTGKTALENEEGKWQYSVNVRSGHTLREVMVDARTGKIADIEVTTAAKESVENANEKAAQRHLTHKTMSRSHKNEERNDKNEK